jgi:hypothetical protein
MRRLTRGRSILRARTILALAPLLLPAAACDPRTASPSPAPVATANVSAGASVAPPTRLPTPVPTAVPGSGGPSPAPTAVAEGHLLIRFVSCGDACTASAGTTILDDGLAIWESADDSGRVLQASLTGAGLARVRAAIAGRPELGADGDFRARLRPGGVAIPHGLGSLRFELGQGDSKVVVTTWDAGSLADQRDQWLVPAEMDALTAFARRLADPVAWLGAEAFAGPPRVYASTHSLVVIDLFADVGESGSFPADVDDVDWPFGSPIEAAGEPVAGDNGIATRCLVVDADAATALRRAEHAAGAHRPLGAWFSTTEYDWRRSDGFVQVSVRQLLPHETGTCRDLVEPSF